MRVRRTVRGIYLVGRHRCLTVKWLRPGVDAIGAGLWQWQVGRFLVRLSRKLSRDCESCGVDHVIQS